MVVELLTVELCVYGAQSLKDKRMVRRRIKNRRKKFNIAVSEVDFHHLHQRGLPAVVLVGEDQPQVDRELVAAAAEIDRVEPGVVTRTDVEFL